MLCEIQFVVAKYKATLVLMCSRQRVVKCCNVKENIQLFG